MQDETRPQALAVPVEAVLVGAIAALANNGSDSGIAKRVVAEARWLDADGVADDAQADRVHHGGPDRALNHYPADHYAYWSARYPDHAGSFRPGVFGENLSTHGITEADVCVGDVFALGGATIQIAQPRQPCWKPGTRIGLKEMARAMAGEGRAGWLYRVLKPGHIRAGDELARIERAHHGITLAELWNLQGLRRPDADQQRRLMTLAEQPTLTAEWRERLARRAGQIGTR